MKHSPLIDRIEALLDEWSMPEVVATLVHLSHEYKERLQREGNREYLGWEPWEGALSTAIREVEGQEELDNLLTDA